MSLFLNISEIKELKYNLALEYYCPLGPIQNSRLISQNGSPNLALEYQALANQNKSRYCSVQLENCMFKNFDQVFSVILL